MEIKNIIDAILKVTALTNERIKTYEDIRKGVDVIAKMSTLMNIRAKYMSIAQWLLLQEYSKGGYTQQEHELGKRCVDEIATCDDQLNNICFNYMKDKVQTELLSALFRR